MVNLYPGILLLAPTLEGVSIQLDVFGFESLGTKPYPVKDVLAFFQGLELDAVKLGVMEEYIFTGIIADKPESSIFD